jgi:hypothetical protein
MKINLNKNPDFLNIELSEAFHFDNFIEFIINLGKKNADRFFIDGTQLENTDLSYKERFDIGNTAVIYLDLNAKYVVLWPRRDINYFAISVMKLHGFNIQVFSNKRHASNWLLG